MHRLTVWTVTLLSTGALLGCAPSAAPTASVTPTDAPQIAEHVAADEATVVTLSNGLTVIVREKRTAPVVCVKAYVRAGGLYEREWLGAGVSHLLEHLVADDAEHHSQSGGGPQKPRDDVSNRVTDIGGQANAYTSLDHTCYYISAASARTDNCIDLVADWLARPQFTRADFEREHGVVQRELEKGKDEPNRQAWYAHMANAFAGHPAAVPVIGYAEPLAALTWDDVRTYHERMYVPQNTVFTVVGDVNTDHVIAETRRAFAGWHRGRAVTHDLPAVAPITGTRRVVRHQADLTEAICRISFRTIPLQHDDLYALDVLSYVLGAGRSSRLHRQIFRKQKLVTSISTSSWTPAWGAGVFTVDYRSAPGKADAAEQAVLAEIRRIVHEGVMQEELARAKRQKIADHVHAQQTAEQLADALARDYMTTGDVAFSAHYTERIQAVTAQQVQAMARQYLDAPDMAVTRLLPEGADADSTDVGETAAAQGGAEVSTLPSGLRVILRPTDVGLVSMCYVTAGGVLAEDEDTNGLGTLMTALSTRGTKHHTADEIDAFFDRAGGGISGNCGNNTFYWQAECLADSFDEAIEIFAEVVTQPTFPPEELEILRPRALAAVKRTEEHWFAHLQKRFRKRFFAGSPYRLLPAGRANVVSKAGVEQLITHHREHVAFRPHESVLAIYGQFDAERLKERLPALFEVHGDPRKTLSTPSDVPAPPRETFVYETNKAQAGVIVAAPGMSVENVEDRIPLTVLDTIISGYHLPSGWLHEELRGKQLVYVVHAYNWAGLTPGAFVVYAGCQPAEAPRVADIIRKNLRRAADYTPTQAEIDRAVNVILTAEALSNQAMSDLAMGAALDELYGLGWDFRRRQRTLYHAVTPADVRRVARTYLSGGFTTVVTTPHPDAFEEAQEP
ncbi:MAG: insulinase family protein [Phycisphaerae bacterium]|nr:insulinase family protein [Phycisphaerae bacterium]